MTSSDRQFRLICYITAELMLVSLIIGFLYVYANLWYLVTVVGLGILLTSVNLLFLFRTHNTKISGHVMVLIIFLTVLFANYLVRGLGGSYSIWFFVIPLLAASLTGWCGLLIYSFLSFLLILGSKSFSIPPYYHFTAQQLLIIEWANHLFAFLIIVTTLGSIIRENKRYEAILNAQNAALQLEKDEYQHLARFDPLTRLPNRLYFKEHAQGILDSLADDYFATVFFMDLNEFKSVNDNYGHDIGDQLLLGAASRLSLCFRKEDFVARLGGDEFTAIILYQNNREVIEAIVNKINLAFEKPFKLKKIRYSCSISIGYATYPKDAKTISALMHQADLAMYAAKTRIRTRRQSHF